MSEERKRAIGTILEAGFQMESDAFKALMEITAAGKLDPLVKEVLRVAGTVEPRPSSISKDLVLRAAEQLDLSGKGAETEHAGLGHGRRFAEDLESRLEVVSDPTGKLGTTGAFDDFLHYFRNRFDKMSLLFRQRMDTRNAGTISDALSGGSNGRGRFICMVLDKREKGDRIFLTVDDYEDEATVLVGRQNSTVYEVARKIVRDQVIYIQARKSVGPLLVAEAIVLPEIPDRKPAHANEEIYAALVSDVHVGSKVFLEDEFRRVLSWLKGDIGTPNQREVAERVKYVLIGGDLVDGIGVYPRQEVDLAVPDIYEQYRLAAKFVSEIPEYMEAVLIPGNHDAVRQALPQPAIPKDFAGPVYDSRKIVSLGIQQRFACTGFTFYSTTELALWIF